MIENTVPKDGYIIDYVSGQEIKGTPEEVEAVQPFAIQLVEDYKYPKTVLQTRPQFRVKASPSDTTKKCVFLKLNWEFGLMEKKDFL